MCVAGFLKDESFGVIARAPGKSSFEAQADMNVSRSSISFAEERSLLMDERLKFQSMSNQSTPPKLAAAPSTPAKAPTIKEVADPSKVTRRNHLLLLCDLYSSIIDANLTPNITTELHFVLSLLVVQGSSPAKKQKPEPENASIEKLEESIGSIYFDKSCSDICKEEKDVINSGEKTVDKQNDSVSEESKSLTVSDSKCISLKEAEQEKGESLARLDTVHNCVFFATNLLWRQRHLLANLDRVTIKLILDNERVAAFMPTLALVVQDMYMKASPRTTAIQNMTASVVFNCSTSENVTFHSERDNSSNFESSNAFRSFRK